VIEVTDEMVELFKLNHDPANELEQPDIRAGLAAVLHIVERNQAAQAEASVEVLAAYRASRAKGYYRSPRGAVAWALAALDEASPP